MVDRGNILRRGSLFMKNFWNTVSDAIANEQFPTHSKRNGLYDLVNAIFSISETLKNIKTYFQNLDDWRVCSDHFLNKGGYLVSLNYYLDNPETKNKEKIETLLKIGLILGEMQRNIKNDRDPLGDKITEGLETLLRESLTLLEHEVSRLKLKEYLKNVTNKEVYLNNYMSVGKNQERKISLFLLNFLNSTT